MVKDLIDLKDISDDFNNNSPRQTGRYRIVDETDVHEELNELIFFCQRKYSREMWAIVPTMLRQCKWSEESLREKVNQFASIMKANQATIERAIEAIVGMAIDTSPESLTLHTFRGTCSECNRQTDIHCLKCRHGICIECWNQYIYYYVSHEEELDIPCSHEGCPVYMSYNQIIHITNGSTRNDYNRLHYKDYLANANVKGVYRCRNTNCTRMLLVENNNFNELTGLFCLCGHSLCPIISCGEEAHPLVHCKTMHQWYKITEQYCESLLSKQSCPECKVSIDAADPEEQFLGCHACGLLYCWGCRSEIQDKECHDCNVLEYYIETTSDCYRRFLLCLQNWMNMHFKELESQELFRKFRIILQEAECSTETTQIVLSSFALLIECRRTLCSAWVILFFITDKKYLSSWMQHIKELIIATDRFAKECNIDMESGKDWRIPLKQTFIAAKKAYDKARYEIEAKINRSSIRRDEEYINKIAGQLARFSLRGF